MTQSTHADARPESALSADDLFLFNEGTHFELYHKLGARLREGAAAAGTNFAVWAPNAEAVSVIGDFNGWDAAASPMAARAESGVWELFIPGVGKGAHYKFSIAPRGGGRRMEKADPFALYCETPPKTASIVWDMDYAWGDAEWMARRAAANSLAAPISIYEVHLGSWRHEPGRPGRSLSYRELAPRLADHAIQMGFTHVEFLPVMEHPFYASWGYQATGFFAPTSRFGSPQDFMFLVDHLHQRGLGVILDWVPSHFPSDDFGLARFDGTALYEHEDPRQGLHPDWNSLIFNYGRHEVRSFLASSAMFWLDRYHADGLRVDAVASMLYLDYSRREGEWIPNAQGGRENLEAISFLRRLNEAAYARHPGIQMIAEESTAWPMVSRPTWLGGLGFGLKWDMGWMHDTLLYFSKDPVHRKYHHDKLTFRGLYAHAENFVLPLSHDEVVHGKRSLLSKMPGDRWRQFANLRLLLALMFAQTGKKLLFMGGEFGQAGEWSHDAELDWGALADPLHAGAARCVERLNRLYREEVALHARDCDADGFEWIDCNDVEQSVVCVLRKAHGARPVLGVFNFTPVPRYEYRVGVSQGGRWRELLNTDAAEYGGSGVGNLGGVSADPRPAMGRGDSICLTLPPLGAIYLTPG